MEVLTRETPSGPHSRLPIGTRIGIMVFEGSVGGPAFVAGSAMVASGYKIGAAVLVTGAGLGYDAVRHGHVIKRDAYVDGQNDLLEQQAQASTTQDPHPAEREM